MFCPGRRASPRYTPPHFPTHPSRAACKEFYPGQVAHEGFNAPPGLLRFFAVFLTIGYDELVDISCLPFRVPFCGQQAQFRIGVGPASRPPKDGASPGIQFDPDKGGGAVSKAPCLHDAPRLAQLWQGDPKEQSAVLVRQLRHGQSHDVLDCHGGIMAFGGVPTAVAPRWVCVDNAIFSYRPNISFTMRSEPRTRPVKISILNTICPMYCHTIVTADRVASAAGVLLDRKAE